MPLKKKAKTHHVLISQGRLGSGLCIYINGYRIVGEKPWGGGSTVKDWTCTDEDIRNALACRRQPPKEQK